MRRLDAYLNRDMLACSGQSEDAGDHACQQAGTAFNTRSARPLLRGLAGMKALQRSGELVKRGAQHLRKDGWRPPVQARNLSRNSAGGR